jgi:long-chain fatty acid transport protein
MGAGMDLHASTGDGANDRVSARPAKGVVVGAEVPVPFGGVLRDRAAVGLALYTPSDTLVRAHILYPETPQFPLLADRAQSLAVRVAAGVDVGWGVRVGAGVAALAQLVGSIAVASSGGAVTSSVEDQLVATYAPTVGVAWDLPMEEGAGARPWRVGVAWRGPLEAHVDVDIDATKLSTLTLPLLHIAGVAQYDPQEVALEVAREDGEWILAAGVTWKQWGAYPGPLEAAVLCPPTQPGCAALAPARVPFSDTIVPRIGLERTVGLPRRVAVRVRGGALLEPTPVPSSLPSSQAYDPATQAVVSVPTRFFDATRFVLSGGAGVDLGDIAPLAVDFFAQVHALVASNVEAPPAAPARVSGTVIASGFAVTVRF